ncbi:MAG: hypothetical protein H7325_00620, partial [Pedobacter sp.]|nr:hypothetical protein [Pedobacter sp.]
IREIDKKDYRDGNGCFSILFMTLDTNRNTGGELIELRNAAKCALPPNCKAHEMRGIKDLDTGKPYPVHNRLIFKFDNKPIYWA